MKNKFSVKMILMYFKISFNINKQNSSYKTLQNLIAQYVIFNIILNILNVV